MAVAIIAAPGSRSVLIPPLLIRLPDQFGNEAGFEAGIACRAGRGGEKAEIGLCGFSPARCP